MVGAASSNFPKVDYCDTNVVHEHFVSDHAEPSYVEEHASGLCWLCGQQDPVATFRKRAHVLPQSLGNKGWLTRDECDACNQLVGGHESALVAALSPYRVTSQFKRGRPKFKDPKSGSFIMSPDRDGNLFVHEPILWGGLAEKRSEDTIVLRIPVDGHRPGSICKVLARIALLLIPSLRLSHDHLRKWILGQLTLPAQPLACGEARAGETLAPCVRVSERAGSGGTEFAVTLAYGGAVYWYALPREPGPISATYVDRSMIEQLIHFAWGLRMYDEDAFVPAGHATITLVAEPTQPPQSDSK